MSVSVVIPCYNQGRFLAEAVASAAAQGELVSEIVVVDDGSTDETREVATRDGSVTYIHQKRQGLSGARNSGWRASSGGYVVFLDADDRLLPGAIEPGIEAFGRWPRAASPSDTTSSSTRRAPSCRRGESCVSRTTSPSRAEISSSSFRTVAVPEIARTPPGQRPLHGDAEAEPHQHARGGLYRRAILEETGGFDPRLKALEDYELYLRVTRAHPVAGHDQVVAQYRRHPAAMSRDTLNMLRLALFVLHEQRPYLARHPGAFEAYQEGLTFWKIHYSKQLIRDVPGHLAAGRLRRASSSCLWPLALAVGAEPRAPHRLAGVAAT